MLENQALTLSLDIFDCNRIMALKDEYLWN